MVWRIEYAKSVQKSVHRIDHPTRRRIRAYLEERVAGLDNPRRLGKALKGRCSDLWRYRVGDYRVICEIRDAALVVLVVRIGHRKEVYN